MPKLLMLFICWHSMHVISLEISNPPDIIGTAFDNKQQLLYTEEHRYLSDTSHHIIYKEPDGFIFSEKKISYKTSFLAPEFVQSNQRNNEYIAINYNDITNINSLFRKDGKHPIKKVSLALNINDTLALVIDAGFDHFIRQYWQKINHSNQLAFNFLSTTRQSIIKLVIKEKPCAENRSYRCFIVTPKNWLLKLIAGQINLQYNRQQQLLVFEGISNIADKNNDYKHVFIRYQHLKNIHSKP